MWYIYSSLRSQEHFKGQLLCVFLVEMVIHLHWKPSPLQNHSSWDNVGSKSYHIIGWLSFILSYWLYWLWGGLSDSEVDRRDCERGGRTQEMFQESSLIVEGEGYYWGIGLEGIKPDSHALTRESRLDKPGLLIYRVDIIFGDHIEWVHLRFAHQKRGIEGLWDIGYARKSLKIRIWGILKMLASRSFKWNWYIHKKNDGLWCGKTAVDKYWCGGMANFDISRSLRWELELD